MASRTARKGWDQVMIARGQLPPSLAARSKRFSGRIRRQVQANRVVDQDTRAQLRDAKLEALEADNARPEDDTGFDGDDGDDDDYEDEDEDQPASRGGDRRRGGTKRKHADVEPWAARALGLRRVRRLADLLAEDSEAVAPAPGPALPPGSVAALAVATALPSGSTSASRSRGSAGASRSSSASASALPTLSSSSAASVPTTSSATTTTASSSSSSSSSASSAASATLTGASAAAAAAAAAGAASVPLFRAATAAPSRYPGRRLCGITGLHAAYTCPRTGTRYATRAAFELVKDKLMPFG